MGNVATSSANETIIPKTLTIQYLFVLETQKLVTKNAESGIEKYSSI